MQRQRTSLNRVDKQEGFSGRPDKEPFLYQLEKFIETCMPKAVILYSPCYTMLAQELKHKIKLNAPLNKVRVLTIQ
jgi:hypothetical protein